MGKGGWRYGAGRPAYRPQAESYRKLDLRRMVKAGCINSGNWFGWQWSNQDGERVASVSCSVNAQANLLTVSYSWSSYYSPEKKPVSIGISLTRTACNYGGERQWFRCPCCHRRAAVLYIMGGALRCATCGRISYASQRGDEVDRIWVKQKKLEAKLIDGWHKPKRMQHKTYKRLINQISECEKRKDNALLLTMARMGLIL